LYDNCITLKGMFTYLPIGLLDSMTMPSFASKCVDQEFESSSLYLTWF